MKKTEFKKLCDLSLLILGHKYAWKKLRTRGLVSEYRQIGRGATARRMPLTVEGVKHYLTKTLEMRSNVQKEQEKKNEEG